jgi:hypothetical protein
LNQKRLRSRSAEYHGESLCESGTDSVRSRISLLPQVTLEDRPRADKPEQALALSGQPGFDREAVECAAGDHEEIQPAKTICRRFFSKALGHDRPAIRLASDRKSIS